MCCGEHEEIDMARVKAAEETAEIFTTDPGAEIRIGPYGVATNDEPVMVPMKVAGEYEGKDGYKVVGGPKAKASAKERAATREEAKAEAQREERAEVRAKSRAEANKADEAPSRKGEEK